MAEMKIDITDVIEKACEKLKAEGYTVQKWIPCSEKKPEIWQEVLVTLNDKGYKSIHIGEMQEEGSCMIGGEFWYEKDDPRITHWMPLPDPPKDVDDA